MSKTVRLTKGTKTLVIKTVRSGGAGAGAASNAFIYQPGGGGIGPSVFGDWATLMLALDAARTAGGLPPGGKFQILFDNSITSPAVIPAGTYDMTNVEWRGTGGATFFVSVSIPEGAIFTGLREIRHFLAIDFTGTTPPVSDFSNFESFFIEDEVKLSCSGAGPFCRITSAITVFFFINENFAGLGTGGPCIDASVSGSTISVFSAGGSIVADTFSGVAGSTLSITPRDTNAIVSSVHPQFLGSFTTNYEGILRQHVRPPRTTAVSTPTSGQLYLMDTTSAAISQTLPAVTTFFPGDMLTFIKTAGANPITISPGGSDTISGGTAPVVLSDPVDSVVFIRGHLTTADWHVLKQPIGPRWNVTAVATSVVTAQLGDLQRCDPSGGAFAVNLPAVTAGNEGAEIIVKNVTASVNAITITPAGADTIDGAATLVINTARGVARIVSNGVSDWMIA